MEKITLKEGTNEENAVFTKTGISIDFSLKHIDEFITNLQKEKEDVSRVLLQLEHFLEKTGEHDIDVNEAHLYDFSVYASYANQIKTAQERIQELDEEFPHFASAFEKLENPQEAVKYINFKLQKKEKESELEMINQTFEKYEQDKKTALSCLQE